MPLFAESEEKIFGDIMYDLVNNTNITRSSRGAKMRALAESVSKKMGRMWSQFDLNIVQAFVDGAEGKYLDFIGDMLGVPRLGDQPAVVSSQDQIVKFYVDIGTFGDINGGSSILIPAGTVISTGKNRSGIQYRVVVNTILDSTASESYIGVQAIQAGSDQNVGSNQLIYHDFTEYVDVNNDSLKITNDSDIINGQDVEIEANYRFRIVNQVVSLESANPTAIRIAALTVPGVADIVSLPFHRGIGTYDLLVKSTVPSIPQSLIDTVQQAVGDVTSQGIVGRVRGPTEIGISLVGTITPRRVLSNEEETNIINAIVDNVSTYINSLDIGEDFVINELIERVMSTSDLIKTIGTPGEPFDKVFLHRPSRLEDNKVRETLITDYSPESDERVIVENRFAGSTPLLFRIA